MQLLLGHINNVIYFSLNLWHLCDKCVDHAVVSVVKGVDALSCAFLRKDQWCVTYIILLDFCRNKISSRAEWYITNA